MKPSTQILKRDASSNANAGGLVHTTCTWFSAACGYLFNKRSTPESSSRSRRYRPYAESLEDRLAPAHLEVQTIASGVSLSGSGRNATGTSQASIVFEDGVPGWSMWDQQYASGSAARNDLNGSIRYVAMVSFSSPASQDSSGHPTAPIVGRAFVDLEIKVVADSPEDATGLHSFDVKGKFDAIRSPGEVDTVYGSATSGVERSGAVSIDGARLINQRVLSVTSFGVHADGTKRISGYVGDRWRITLEASVTEIDSAIVNAGGSASVEVSFLDTSKVRVKRIDAFGDIDIADVPDRVFDAATGAKHPIADVITSTNSGNQFLLKTTFDAGVNGLPTGTMSVYSSWEIAGTSGGTSGQSWIGTATSNLTAAKPYVELSIKMPPTVGQYQLKLKFSIKDAQGNQVALINVPALELLAIYQNPAEANPRQEWLRKGTEWASGAQSDTEVATKMLHGIYDESGWKYRPEYNQWQQLKGIGGNINEGDCRTMSEAWEGLCRSLGVYVGVKMVETGSYIMASGYSLTEGLEGNAIPWNAKDHSRSFGRHWVFARHQIGVYNGTNYDAVFGISWPGSNQAFITGQATRSGERADFDATDGRTYTRTGESLHIVGENTRWPIWEYEPTKPSWLSSAATLISNSLGNFYRTSPSTAATTLLGQTSVSMTDFAISADGRIYGLAIVNGESRLYRIAVEPGDTGITESLIGSTGAFITSIAFRSDGTLWGVGRNELHRINLSTSTATRIVSGPEYIMAEGGIAFDTADNLYFISKHSGGLRLMRVSSEFNRLTEMGSLGLASFKGLKFDQGRLFAVANDATLVEINTANAATTLVASLTGDWGAAFVIDLPYILEDTAHLQGTTIASLLGDRFANPDGNTKAGIAIVLTAGNGTWQFSADGTTWSRVGMVASSEALLLPRTYRIRFVPTFNWAGRATLQFRSWDGSQGTAGQTTSIADGFSTEFAVIKTTVKPVNDAHWWTVQPTPSNQAAILSGIVDAAIERWATAGLSASGIDHLRTKYFAFADLDGDALAKVLGNTILLDRDAGGQLWFVDSTPLLDEEFAATSSSAKLLAQAATPAGAFFDLETVVLREMAKSLGVPPSMSPELLTGNLSVGVRYLPKLDSSFQLKPNAAWSAVDLEQLSALRMEYGFVSGGGKWFLDRANQWYSISSDGALRKYGVNTLIATLSPLVFDDPSLLTKAPVSLTDAQKAQLSQLKTTYGFVSGGGKWFLDRGNQWYSIGSDGTLRKYGTNQLIATVSIRVFDDPTLLSNAPVALTDAEKTQLSHLRMTLGLVSGGGKWFLDRSSQWLFIQSDGELRRYGTNALVATLSPLVFDSPSLLSTAPVSLTNAEQTQLSQLRETHGFVSGGGKWFLDRSNQWHFVRPDGTLRKYGTNQLVATVSVLVFDDPSLLTKAPVSLTQFEQDQIGQLKLTYGFVSGGGKWLQDRSSQWFFISADGTLRKYGTNQLVATLSVLVFDDPTLLTRAPVTLSDAEQAQLSQLRLAYGFVSGGGKWFQDRSSQWYFISADGGLRKYGTNTLIATLSVLAFDDPRLLTRAPVTMSHAEQIQLSQLRLAYGFVSGGGKWFQDRSSRWFFISADGTVRKYGNNQVVATLSVLVFDDPTLLAAAYVG